LSLGRITATSGGGGGAASAAGSVFLTTVFSILTVPLCAYILELVV
jgi:predicted permease